MKKKTKLVVLLTGFAVAAFGCAVPLMLQNGQVDKTKSLGDDYSITINPTDITSSPSSFTGSVTLKTDQLKNDVTFDVKNVHYDSEGGYLVVEEGGYIANAATSQIRSITSVTVNGVSHVFDYYLGWEATGTTIDYDSEGYYYADGSIADLSSYTPNYIKLAYRAVDVRIDQITLTLDKSCTPGTNPFVARNGLLYRKRATDAVVVGFAGISLDHVTIEDDIDELPVTEIAEKAFYNDNELIEIVLGAYLHTIGTQSFKNCGSLSSVIGLNDIGSIGEQAFAGCSLLSGTLSFTSSLNGIGNSAFYGVDGITSITFADTGNPYVPDSAFRDMDGLTSVHIGSEMTQVYEDFYQCENLETITVGSGNTKYSAIDNVLFDDQYHLVNRIAQKRSQTSFTLPSGYRFGPYCGFGSSTLETLVLNDTEDEIPDYAFNECTALTSINFGTNPSLRIADGAFRRCTALERLNFSSNVVFVGEQSFANCTALKTAVFDNGCATIERGAFKDCTSLNSVLLPNTLTSLGQGSAWSGPADIFDGCTALTHICTRLDSGTYMGENIETGWDGGRDLAYYSELENLDGHHYRMVDGAARVWNSVSVTFKVYRSDIGTGWAIYFLGDFNTWIANVDSRGNYVVDHWELTITLVTWETYEFKGAVSTWNDPESLVYEAGLNHSWMPEDSAFEYVINWQY